MKKILARFSAVLFCCAALQLTACGKKPGVFTDTTLTPAEKQSLAFMREEEKLAFDVYTLMDSKWGLLPFQHIKQSESNHMAMVKGLLDKYGEADPAAGKGSGEYTNTVISGLFTLLRAKGDSSEVQSLTVGALIEEVDLRDLGEQIQSVEKADIKTVYENLMRGSRNHLRAFVGQLAARGITYQPQYLSPAEFDTIIRGAMERGGGYRGGQSQ